MTDPTHTYRHSLVYWWWVHEGSNSHISSFTCLLVMGTWRIQLTHILIHLFTGDGYMKDATHSYRHSLVYWWWVHEGSNSHISSFTCLLVMGTWRMQLTHIVIHLFTGDGYMKDANIE